MRPETKPGIADKEDGFAIDRVVALFELLGVITLEHGIEVGVFEADAFDFVLRQMAGTPGDGEPPFG